MNRRIPLFSGISILMLLLACGPKVMIPPKVELRTYGNVGIIGFGCDAEGNLSECLTQRLLEAITESQKGVHIVELGSEEQVLLAVQSDRIDSAAVQKIGQKYGVDVLITGYVDVVELTPIVERYSQSLTLDFEDRYKPDVGKEGVGRREVEGERVKAVVKASVITKLWETQPATAVWSSSAEGEEMVKGVRVLKGGQAIFDADDPRFDYRDLVRPIVKEISSDFKVRYKRASKK
jgi:hypothetical protein